MLHKNLLRAAKVFPTLGLVCCSPYRKTCITEEAAVERAVDLRILINRRSILSDADPLVVGIEDHEAMDL